MSNTQNNKKITAKGRETKDKIFRTAVELFSKNGFYGVSIRDITSAINIKESSLYHHYLSKEDLINDIYFYFEIRRNKIRRRADRFNTCGTRRGIPFCKNAFRNSGALWNSL